MSVQEVQSPDGRRRGTDTCLFLFAAICAHARSTEKRTKNLTV